MSSKGKSSYVAGGGAALVPKLRFPEFKDAGAWDTASGDELFQQANNREAPPGLPILAISQEHGAIPRHMIDYHVSVTDKSLETYKEVRPGDFIISLRSFQGGIEFSDYHGICSPAYVILRKRGRLSDSFYRQHFKSNDFIQQLTRNLEGLRDGKMISYKQFSELQLLKPGLPEQQKIADCLASADALIEAQGRKVEALKAHKKGLMQQLFPQEGETQPRLRFPEFEGAGEWKQATLSTMADFVNQKTPLANVTLANYISTENILSDFLGVVPASKMPSAGAVTKYMPEDVLVSNIRPYLKKIWVADKEGGASNDVIVIRAKQALTKRFLAGLLKNDQFIVYVMSGAKGVKMPRGDLDSIRSYPIAWPSLHEQQRIADCLTSLDELIAAETRKLDTLKTHKKGLMQQLFPQVGEAEA